MNRGIKITLLVVIGIIILAGIMFLIWALIYKPPVIFAPEAEETTPVQTDTLPANGGSGASADIAPTQPSGPKIETIDTEAAELQKVRNTAKLFAERFASFSNQGNFQNIEDLRPLMTESMESWADNYITENQPEENEEYYGISSKVIATNEIDIDLDNGTAELNLDMQRRETQGDQDERVYYQTLNVKMVKTGNNWLIDSVQWQ